MYMCVSYFGLIVSNQHVPSDWLVRLLWGRSSVMARYGWFVREVQLDTNRSTNQPTNRWDFLECVLFFSAASLMVLLCFHFSSDVFYVWLSIQVSDWKNSYSKWRMGDADPNRVVDGDVKPYWLLTLLFPPFRLAASLLWCWSWEKDGRAVEVVPGIYAVHWKFSMCTATRTSSYSPVGPSMFLCVHI